MCGRDHDIFVGKSIRLYCETIPLVGEKHYKTFMEPLDISGGGSLPERPLKEHMFCHLSSFLQYKTIFDMPAFFKYLPVYFR